MTTKSIQHNSIPGSASIQANKFDNNVEYNEELSKILNNMVGKKVSLINSHHYLLRVSGIMSIKDGMIRLNKNTDQVSILIDSILSFNKTEFNNQITFRFVLQSGHCCDLVY